MDFVLLCIPLKRKHTPKFEYLIVRKKEVDFKELF